MKDLKEFLTETAVKKVVSEKDNNKPNFNYLSITEAKIDNKLKRKIINAVDDANEEFWKSISKSFPEIKYGDVDPGASYKLEKSMVEMVTHWYTSNKED